MNKDKGARHQMGCVRQVVSKEEFFHCIQSYILVLPLSAVASNGPLNYD